MPFAALVVRVISIFISHEKARSSTPTHLLIDLPAATKSSTIYV